jgi:hypothetical protein
MAVHHLTPRGVLPTPRSAPKPSPAVATWRLERFAEPTVVDQELSRCLRESFAVRPEQLGQPAFLRRGDRNHRLLIALCYGQFLLIRPPG